MSDQREGQGEIPGAGPGEAPAGAAQAAEAPEVSPERARAYWRANLRIMALLLAVWAFVSYGLGILWVEPLNRFALGGFPLGFWFAQQGSIYVFVLLIFVYAVWMDRLDAHFRVG